MGFESIDQPGGPSDVERNPKMSISCFWLERVGRWCLSPSTSPADHQKLNIIQKWAFHYFGWRWGLSPSTGPANHQKLNVIQKWAFHYFGWRWGLSPSTSLSNHQKLNVIQKQAFHFYGWRGMADGVWVHWPACPIIRSWTKSKKEHFIFLAAEQLQMLFESINQPGQSSEVEHNFKMSISYFWLERGGRRDLSTSTSPADHQKLNIIQKWAFHFFRCRGVVDGVQVHQPAWPIIRNWT